MLLIVLIETHVLQTGIDLFLQSISVFLCMFRTVMLRNFFLSVFLSFCISFFRKYKFLMELESEGFIPCSQATALSLYGVCFPSTWVKAGSEMFAV